MLTPGTTIAGKVLERSNGGGFFAPLDISSPAHDARWSIRAAAANWALKQNKHICQCVTVMADQKFTRENDTSSERTGDEESARSAASSDEQSEFEDTIATIYKVAQDVASIEMEIHNCSHWDFRKLDEMLIQQILKLDSLDPKGNEKIKEERKRVIKYVQDCMRLLDVKTGRCNENDDEI